ncbi:hypothetical protein Pcinc_012378 [Petrolisthes cinctipes]|uniref:MADF domain-containing protein n=1 Tax=Petrolisthes cinctipes TaxID=88211 RepID=A0AAE1KTP2_PETCI|nr:hypothetical protein Pcinc_012378 [Petrolisthes cinctipes]
MEVVNPEDFVPPPPPSLDTVPEQEADTEDNGDWIDIPRTDAETSDEEGHHYGLRAGRRNPLQLPADVERELGEWLQENTFLYDRSLNEYRNKPRKDRVRKEKGATLNPSLSGDNIERWIKSMRMRYGKLTKLKSGSGSKTMTEQDKWILDLFGFLGKHIVRQKTPKTLGVKESAAVAALAPAPTPVPQNPGPSTSTSAPVSASTSSTPTVTSDEAAPLGSLEEAQQASRRGLCWGLHGGIRRIGGSEPFIFEMHDTAMERFLGNQVQQKEAKRDRDVEWWRSSLTDFIAHQLRPVHRSYIMDLVAETTTASTGPPASSLPPPPFSAPGSSTPTPPPLPRNPGFTPQQGPGFTNQYAQALFSQFVAAVKTPTILRLDHGNMSFNITDMLNSTPSASPHPSQHDSQHDHDDNNNK